MGWSAGCATGEHQRGILAHMPQARTSTSDADVRPPNPPWLALAAHAPDRGYLSYYYSDDLSALAVRAVTRLGDNKSDPNLETATYGLFSTCERQMRAGVVNQGLPYLFFVTRRGRRRVLAGYYRIAWYCAGPFSQGQPDSALAANRLRFVHPPLPFDELPDGLREHATRRFRTSLRADAGQTQQLLELLEARPDRTADYLGEIDRLERFNRYHTGFRCWQRTEPFGWQAARDYLHPEPTDQWSTAEAVANRSPTGRWHCLACDRTIRNDALLKACPACNALGSLRPVTSV